MSEIYKFGVRFKELTKELEQYPNVIFAYRSPGLVIRYPESVWGLHYKPCGHTQSGHLEKPDDELETVDEEYWIFFKKSMYKFIDNHEKVCARLLETGPNCTCTRKDIQCDKEDCIGRWVTLGDMPSKFKDIFAKKLLGIKDSDEDNNKK